MPKFVYLRLPDGAPVPMGYEAQGRQVTTRSGGTYQIYRKPVLVVNKPVFDELASLFEKMGVNEQSDPGTAVAVVDELGITNLFGNLSVQGGKRKSRRTRRRARRN